MLRITDRLLSLENMDSLGAGDLRELYALLARAGVSKIEVSPAVLEKLGGALDPSVTVLRLDALSQRARYPGLAGYVARGFNELSLGEAGGAFDIERLARQSAVPVSRACGLDALFPHNCADVFGKLLEYSGSLEFCPGDAFGLASALAVEWIASGGRDVVTAFLGRGALAATEEVIMAMRVTRRYRPGLDLSVFAELARVYERASGSAIPPRKSVVGSRIFSVESGIHVDGILKSPSNYEPFPPESVGMKRAVTLGKHSGRSSVAHKLRERGVRFPPERVSLLLRDIRALSEEKSRGVTDAEFAALVEKHGGKRAAQE